MPSTFLLRSGQTVRDKIILPGNQGPRRGQQTNVDLIAEDAILPEQIKQEYEDIARQQDELDTARKYLNERQVALERLDISCYQKIQRAMNLCLCNCSVLCSPWRILASCLNLPLDVVLIVLGYQIPGREVLSVSILLRKFFAEASCCWCIIWVVIMLFSLSYGDSLVEGLSALPLVGHLFDWLIHFERMAICFVSTYIFWYSHNQCSVRIMNFEDLGDNKFRQVEFTPRYTGFFGIIWVSITSNMYHFAQKAGNRLHGIIFGEKNEAQKDDTSFQQAGFTGTLIKITEEFRSALMEFFRHISQGSDEIILKRPDNKNDTLGSAGEKRLLYREIQPKIPCSQEAVDKIVGKDTLFMAKFCEDSINCWQCYNQSWQMSDSEKFGDLVTYCARMFGSDCRIT